MQNTQLPLRTGFVPPAHHGQTSIPLSQGGDVLGAFAPQPGAPSVACASDIHSPSILVIDDSPTIRKVVEKMLCHEGYQSVKTFSDGLAALQWLREKKGPLPQLILLDIELPKMDGYAIARVLKAKPALAHTTIVMMSSHDGVIDRIKGQLVGAQGFLPKPFTVKELLGTVGPYLHQETSFDSWIEERNTET